MQDVLVETAIPDDVDGQLFWKKCFLGKEAVPFREFAVQFFDQFPSLKGKTPKSDEEAIMSGYIGEIKVRSALFGFGMLSLLYSLLRWARTRMLLETLQTECCNSCESTF